MIHLGRKAPINEIITMSDNIYGIHAVQSILANSPERLIEVFVLKGREDKRLQPLLNEL